MNRFENRRKNAFLNSRPIASIDDKNDKLSELCKFNFHYMDFSQSAGQKFEDWNQKQLTDLLNKLKNYCGRSLSYWMTQFVGGGGKRSRKKRHHILEIYDCYPAKTEFTEPKTVPHQASWARFRLEGKVRLIGFVLPNEYDAQEHVGTKRRFDCNTFYVVFLDQNHVFYKS